MITYGIVTLKFKISPWVQLQSHTASFIDTSKRFLCNVRGMFYLSFSFSTDKTRIGICTWPFCMIRGKSLKVLIFKSRFPQVHLNIFIIFSSKLFYIIFLFWFKVFILMKISCLKLISEIWNTGNFIFLIFKLIW